MAANTVNRLIPHLVRAHRLLVPDGPCKTMVGGENRAAGRTLDLIDCSERKADPATYLGKLAK